MILFKIKFINFSDLLFIIHASIYESNLNIISVLALVKLFINHFNIIIKYICWYLYFQQKADCKTGEWHNEGDLKMTLEHKNGVIIITTLLIFITVLMYLYNSYPHKLDIKLIYPSYNIEGIQKTLNVTSFVYHNYSVSMEAVYKNIEGNIHFIHQTDDLVHIFIPTILRLVS